MVLEDNIDNLITDHIALHYYYYSINEPWHFLYVFSLHRCTSVIDITIIILGICKTHSPPLFTSQVPSLSYASCIFHFSKCKYIIILM